MSAAAVLNWVHDAQVASAKTGVPTSLLLADIQQESGGIPNEVSSAGAKGLTQFEPATAAEYGVQFGSTPAEEQSQITGQAEYLKALGALTNPTAALEGYLTGTAGSPAGASYAASVLGNEGSYSAYNLTAGATPAGSSTPSTSTSSTGAGGLLSTANTSELLYGTVFLGALILALYLLYTGLDRSTHGSTRQTAQAGALAA